MRTRIARQLARLRSRVADQDAPATPPPSSGAPRQRARRRRDVLIGQVQEAVYSPRVRIGLVAALMALLSLLLLPRLLPGISTEEFTVLVAPFRSSDDGRTGAAVAEDLARAINAASEGRIVAQVLGAPPENAAAALAVAEQRGADAVIWGEVTPGGMLDQESLLPEIVYRPTGSLAANAWEGYVARFALPDHYILASRPIVGGVVVPQLITALADYGAGQVDRALYTLDSLIAQEPALLPALPNVVRGNILWARGEYRAAAEAYRRAIADSRATDTARLYNNLGAILQDAGDAAGAREAFNQTILLLDGRDLGELRYNLALESLRAGDAAAAVQSLEAIIPPDANLQMPQLVPSSETLLLRPSAQLLLTMSQAYRLNGQLDMAAERLSNAAERAAAEDVLTVPELRDLLATRLRSGVMQERALLTLARQVGASGPLIWELQAAPPLPATVIDSSSDQIESAIAQSEQLIALWSRRSAAEDAAGRNIAGRIAVTQAQRIGDVLAEQRRWKTVVDIELLQTRGPRPRQGLDALWALLTGAGTPVTPIAEQLQARMAAEPDNHEPRFLLGDALVIAGDPAAAIEQYEAAARLAPEAPEPPYGLALAALPQDPARARELLQRSIELNDAYFPAHQRLAELAEQQHDWPTAIAERRWLHQHRPSDATALALATTLRLSGPTGYAEAERVLLPLANRNNVGALIELAELYRASGDLQATRTVLERAERVTPRGAERYPDIAYEMGRLLVAEENIAEAEIQFEAALSADPRHIPSLLALAQINRNNPQVATRNYRAALDAGEDNPETLRQIGQMLLAYREDELAATAFERAVSVDPSDPSSHYGLALARLRLNQLDATQQEATRAIELAGGAYPAAQVVLGDVALHRGDIATAVEQYNAALRQNDSLATAYIGLGRAAAAENRWSVALGHFRNATLRDPQSAEAHLWLGEALLREGDPQAAANAYADATGLREDYAEAYLGLAQAQIQLNQIAQAEESLRRALERRPDYPEAYLVQGRLYEQQGLEERALEAYGQAIRVGDLAEPHFRRAIIRIRSGRLEDARGDLEDAVRLQPVFPEAHYWLGRVHFAQSQYNDAIEHFRLAVSQQDDGYPEARYYQGLAEELAGRPAEAAASYQAVIEKGAGSIWASEAREALAGLDN